MITVCPRKLDFRSLIVNYFNKYNNISRGPEIDKGLKRQAVKVSTRHRLVLETTKIERFGGLEETTPFETCYGNRSDGTPRESSDACEFVKLLRGLAMATPDNAKYRDDWLDTFTDYAASIATSGTKPSLAGLKEFYTDFTGNDVSDDDIKLPETPETLTSDTAKAYRMFFPIIKDASSVGWREWKADLFPLRSVDEIERIPSITEVDELGHLFGHLMRLQIETEGKIIFEEMAESINTKLGIQGASDWINKYKWIEYMALFDGDAEQVPSSTILRNRDNAESVTMGCNHSMGMGDACQEGQNISSQCMEYCKRVEHGRQMESALLELFNMGIESVNQLEPNSPRSLLPDCTWTEGTTCWEKIITDRGICFTSYWQGELRKIDCCYYSMPLHAV